MRLHFNKDEFSKILLICRQNFRKWLKSGKVLIRTFSDVGKPFLFANLEALSAKSENKKRLFNVREGLDYPTACH